MNKQIKQRNSWAKEKQAWEENKKYVKDYTNGRELYKRILLTDNQYESLIYLEQMNNV